LVGGCTRALKIEMNERTNLRFECGEIGKAAFEEIAGLSTPLANRAVASR